MIFTVEDLEAAFLGGAIIAIATSLHLYLAGRFVDPSDITNRIVT
jgi:hypothetical protein